MFHLLEYKFLLLFPKQKARDNRAALRINKVQMSNDPLKRQQQQDSIDPGSRVDSDLFKDPLKQRESEHEQEWKFRQVCVFVFNHLLLNCIFTVGEDSSSCHYFRR